MQDRPWRAALRRDAARDDPARGSGTAAAMTDAEVIAASHEQRELFALIYDRHAPALYRYAARRLGADAAEDVVSETMLAAFRRADAMTQAAATRGPGCSASSPARSPSGGASSAAATGHWDGSTAAPTSSTRLPTRSPPRSRRRRCAHH